SVVWSSVATAVWPSAGRLPRRRSPLRARSGEGSLWRQRAHSRASRKPGVLVDMPGSAETPMQPTPDFDPAAAAKKLLREGRSGALATLMPGAGDPYCSLVNFATAADGAPLLLISRLAVHTKNILADPRVSLLIYARKEGDRMEGARVLLVGCASATE